MEGVLQDVTMHCKFFVVVVVEEPCRIFNLDE